MSPNPEALLRLACAVKAHEELQATDRHYLGETTMALLNAPPTDETVATAELMTAWSNRQRLASGSTRVPSRDRRRGSQALYQPVRSMHGSTVCDGHGLPGVSGHAWHGCPRQESNLRQH